ncbi:hypothetical protein [Amycolatopsis suaedae]|uniref:Uncharacterized protein n=1 Tax=Amycolatopsis suaedae TaxID=2510978 RepID=A0A4V2EMR8_9PSEU|nr:hypothetical protein [Amycolatopsis suaedae]RZQ66055.1 hypothetical protein EWH70_03060 [Amycolatopsis suaedae]
MVTNIKLAVGAAAVLAGVVLMAFFWDLEFFWFQGGPLGLVLTLLGGWDLVETIRKKERVGPARDRSSVEQDRPKE